MSNTENRSSNTDMVSDSEMTECQFHNNCGGWCETRRELEHNLCEHCLESHDEEMSEPTQAKQPQAEPAKPYGWHVEWLDSGDHYLFTKVEKRIEVLRFDSDVRVVPLYTHPAPSDQQGEPVAYLCKSEGAKWLQYGSKVGSPWKPGEVEVTPLYTHADPGEVEQLSQIIRDLNDERDELGAEAGNLRAQLAERDALLRESLDELDKGPSTFSKAALRNRIHEAISGSTERNQCDGCQAGIPLVNGTHRMGKPGGYADTMSCQAGRYASAELSAPKFSDNWTPPDTIKIQITAEEMKRLGLKDPAAPKYCGKVKVVYGHGDYGRCGSDERSPGIPAQCDDCKNAKVVDMPTIMINDDEQMPDIVYDSCQFIGRNADGSEPFTFGTTADGRRTITKIDFRGWKCYGPMQDAPSASVPLCSTCKGYGKYQDGDSGTDEDGRCPNIVECECDDSERMPQYRASAPEEIERAFFKAGQDLLIGVKSIPLQGAPVEIDERAEFESWCAVIGYTLKTSEHGNGFKPGYGSELFSAWKARAALERKP